MRLNRIVLFALLTVMSVSWSAQQSINVGSSPNDGTGEPARAAFQKANANFDELYNRLQPALTGPVTTPGNSNQTSVTPGSLTNSMQASMPANTIKCNNTGSANTPTDCSISQALTLLTSTSGGGTTTFLAADGTFRSPAGSGSVSSVGLSMPGIFSVTSSPVTGSGTISVAANGTSGGIPYFSNSSSLASSAALTASQLIVGGGAGNPPLSLGAAGTSTQVLHGNASGAPSFGAVALAADVSGQLPNANLANMAASTTKCNPNGSSGTPSDCSVSQMQTLLSVPAAYNVNTMLTGSGVPNNAIGVNGQYYVDVGTGKLYQRQSGVFVLLSNWITVNNAPGTNYIKWHPGHGMMVMHLDSTNTDAQIKGYLDQIKHNNNFNFAHLIFNWRDVEPTTQGVYDFSLIRRYRDYINNVTNPGSFDTPKYITVEFLFEKFGETDPTAGTRALPQWIIDAGLWSIVNGHYVANLNNTTAQNGYRDMLRALAAEFDTDPWFEGIYLSETTSQTSQTPYRNLLTDMKAYWTHTNVIVEDNWIVQASGEAANTYHAFEDFYIPLGVGIGGPDILTAAVGENNGQQTFRGVGDIVISGTTYHMGTTDYRGQVPNILQKQLQWGSQTPAQLIDYCQQQKCTHLPWWSGGSSPASWSEVASAVAADPTLYTTCPTRYNGLCRSTP